MNKIFLTVSVILIHMSTVNSQSGVYKIGVGIGDITGPPAEIVFMGYVDLSQTGQGIHTRQYARTVIIGDGIKTIVYISLDLSMVSQLIRLEVVKRIKDNYNGAYNINNIMIASTHTHSAPGGFLNYLFYNIPTFGFVDQVFEAIVSGILKSIDRAHNSIKDGYIYYNDGELLDASINRSPTSYLLNPESERNEYTTDTDKTMQVLKFTDTTGTNLGAVVFFAVHATSMNKTNRLISADNKGVASYLFEKAMNPIGTLPGTGDFVALFPNSNSGDSSPNTKGGFCAGTTTKCDSSFGDCGGDCSQCIAPGPGRDQEESTFIIGQMQFDKAKSLFDTASIRLTGPIDFIYEAIDMTQYPVIVNGIEKTTCKAGVGASMFAGTTDGPGLSYVCQGITSAGQLIWNLLFGPNNPLWNKIAPAQQFASDLLTACQAPKSLYLPTGEFSDLGVPVHPIILPTQILRIGNVVIVGLPAEFTTMAGRRMRKSVSAAVQSNIDNPIVALSGVTNAYSSYVTTFEEYQAQRYEAASTLYGPYTLSAYLDQFVKLATKMISSTAPDTTLSEPNYYAQVQSTTLNFVPKNIADLAMPFGKVLSDANSSYKIGDTVSVTFQGAYPNNYLRNDDTYLTVEKCNDPLCATATVIARDADWETKFKWSRPTPLIGVSEVTITWTIPPGTPPNTYRIKYYGDYLVLLSYVDFVGTSNTFRVTTS